MYRRCAQASLRALTRTLAAALPCARRAVSELVAPAAAALADPRNRTTLALAAAGALAAAAAGFALADGARLRRRVAAAEADVRQLRSQVAYVHACMSAQRGSFTWRDRAATALPAVPRTRIYIS